MITFLHEPYLELLHKALLAVTPTGAKVAIDLGCGDGTKTCWLYERCADGALVIGIDRQAAVLRQRPGLALIAADAADLPLRDECVDLIWCIAALPLFTDQQRALREMLRVLRGGGRLVLATVGEYWVRLRVHADELVAILPSTPLPLPPADGLGEEWSLLLSGVGWQPLQIQAYLLTGCEPAQVALIDSNILTTYLGCSPMSCVVDEPQSRHILLVISACKPYT